MAEDLSELARRHLWMHFTRLGEYGADRPVPVIVRGEGCDVVDASGNRYLDAMSGLFAVQLGHGRPGAHRGGPRTGRDARVLPNLVVRPSTRHPARSAPGGLAPGDLDRVFFTTGGSEAVESAWKLVRQYFRVTGQSQRHKVIARQVAYHGSTLGALAVTGVSSARIPFEPLTPGAVHVMNTNRYRHPLGRDEHAFMLAATDAIEDAIRFEGPETVAAVFLEPVQNGGGSFVPPAGYFDRVREICDRHGVLLVSDEVICAFGRIGTMFGCERYGYLPDLVTCAKGLTSGYSPLGAVLCRDFLAEPFVDGGQSFAHGLTFGGHPVSCAVGLANVDLFRKDGILDHVREQEPGFRERLEGLRDLPVVGDVRGAGYFYAVEVVPDQATEAVFRGAERDEVLAFLPGRLAAAGLISRVDARGEVVIQVAPPLVAGSDELDRLEAGLRSVLTETAAVFGR